MSERGSKAGNWPDMVQFGKHFYVRRRERPIIPIIHFAPKAKMGKEKKHPHKNRAASKV